MHITLKIFGQNFPNLLSLLLETLKLILPQAVVAVQFETIVSGFAMTDMFQFTQKVCDLVAFFDKHLL